MTPLASLGMKGLKSIWDILQKECNERMVKITYLMAGLVFVVNWGLEGITYFMPCQNEVWKKKHQNHIRVYMEILMNWTVSIAENKLKQNEFDLTLWTRYPAIAGWENIRNTLHSWRPLPSPRAPWTVRVWVRIIAISQLVDEVAQTFRRLPPCFRGPAIQWIHWKN